MWEVSTAKILAYDKDIVTKTLATGAHSLPPRLVSPNVSVVRSRSEGAGEMGNTSVRGHRSQLSGTVCRSVVR